MTETRKRTYIEEYWLKKLAGDLPEVSLPRFGTNETGEHLRESLYLDFSPPLSTQLKKISKDSDKTLYILCFACLDILLHKYSGVEDLIVGMLPPAESGSREILLCRTHISADLLVKEAVNRVKQAVLEAFTHWDYSFDEMYRKLRIRNASAAGDIYNIAFIYEKLQSRSEALRHFGLVFILSEGEEGLRLEAEYDPAQYRPETIRGFLESFICVSDNIQEKLSHAVGTLNILSDREKERLLVEFNDSSSPFPGDRKVHELFEDRVAHFSHCTALIYDDQHVTYDWLNEKAACLAHRLSEKGVGQGTVVPILVDRSLEMMTAIFAVLKTGGAYLPLDTRYPPARMRHILNDSAARLLLTTTAFENRQVEQIFIDELASGGPPFCKKVGPKTFDERHNSEIPSPGGVPVGRGGLGAANASLAYIIYTSGSTGKPKGVMVEHPAVVNILHYLFETYPLGKRDRYLLKTSFVFDVSVSELFGWFRQGSALVILKKGEHREPGKMLNIIESANITHINFVPSMFKFFLDFLNRENIKKISRLKYIFLAGEALKPELVNRFRAFANRVILENLYGPSEGTVYASRYSLLDWQDNDRVPIGKPVNNTHLYILNKHQNLQPIGVPGELCIAGHGLARGYLNQPELTHEKFLRSFFQKATPRRDNNAVRDLDIHENRLPVPLEGARAACYKTGDLARWLPDGNIEYLGRIDHQVKIRGNRIELGEIENRLLQHEKIASAVVTAREDDDGGQYLCAYIVVPKEPRPVGDEISYMRPDSSVGARRAVPGEVPSFGGVAAGRGGSGTEPGNIDPVELREHISRTLPDYMMPSFFVQLEKIPLTSSGKVDRKSLPKPGIETAAEYIAPRNETEKKLAAMWAKVLGIKSDSIGIESNFFHLGGHSLKATILATQIEKHFKVEFPLSVIFDGPTVRSAANHIIKARPRTYEEIKPVEKKDSYPLSSAQKRLFFLDQFENIGVSYNFARVLKIQGEVDKNRLERAFRLLIERHESLRTSFEFFDDAPVQRVHDRVDFNLEEIPPVKGSIRENLHEFVRPFDLSKAPLMRAAALFFSKTEFFLFLDIHHIVTDGSSMGFLFDDFFRLYNGSFLEELLPLPIQYKDFSNRQNRLFSNGEIRNQADYWLNLYPGDIPKLDIPTDYQRPATLSFAGEHYEFKLGPPDSGRFLSLCESCGVTLYMNLLAALSVLLHKYSGQEDIVVGTAVMGRRFYGLERIIGMFVNSLALRFFPAGEKTYLDFLMEVKESSLKAFENQDLQFEELVDRLEIERDASRNPLFDVVFVVQNFEKAESNIAGTEFSYYPAFENRVARFDITLYAQDADGEIFFLLEYSTKLFKKSTMEKMMQRYIDIIRSVVDNKEIKIKDIDITPDLCAVNPEVSKSDFNF